MRNIAYRVGIVGVFILLLPLLPFLSPMWLPSFVYIREPYSSYLAGVGVVGILLFAYGKQKFLSESSLTISAKKWKKRASIAGVIAVLPFVLTYAICLGEKPGDACGDIILLFSPLIFAVPIFVVSFIILLIIEIRRYIEQKRMRISGGSPTLS